MNYEQAVKYLLSLGRELASPQQASATKFDLQNITALTKRMGRPYSFYPTVHVAGTNGKGSTAAMIASILRAAGLRTGLYTSPHLVRINERMRINGDDISDDVFAQVFDRVHEVIEELLAAGTLVAHPTYFECVTAMAFQFFAQEKAEVAVIEVGMGGRLDSTNVITPEVAVITAIDFDHENFLGHALKQIAAEKAGIIKPNALVINAAARPEAIEVIRRRAAEQNARVIEPESAYDITDLCAEDGLYRFVATPRDAASAGGGAIEVRLPLAGRYQVRNALTAIAAARSLTQRGFHIDDGAIARGLFEVRWPGRLERMMERPIVYIDGTHNPSGARELLTFWRETFPGRRIHLVYGTLRDKAVDEVAGILFPHAASVILTQSRQPRSLSAETLAEMTGHLASSFEIVSDPAAALQRAIERAAPEDVVFATGSLYLVGEFRRYWQTGSAAPAAPHTALK